MRQAAKAECKYEAFICVPAELQLNAFYLSHIRSRPHHPGCLNVASPDHGYVPCKFGDALFLFSSFTGPRHRRRKEQ
jgi:hypothetical protein